MSQVLNRTYWGVAAGALLCWAGLIAPGCASAATAKGSKQPAHEELAGWLEGAMDSSAQAMRDRHFLDVRMTHCRVQVKEVREPAAFLYVEQALSLRLEAPYRQRILKLSPGPGGTVLSAVYEPAEPKRLVGLCQKPQSERVFALSDLGQSDCSVRLERKDAAFIGSTPEGGCPSSLRGAQRVTSETQIRAEGMDSLDRGWAADGKQVWGSEHGPYQFRKIDPQSTDVEINAITARVSGLTDSHQQAAEDPSFINVTHDNCPVELEPGPFGQGGRIFFDEQSANSGGFRFERRNIVHVRRATDGRLEMAFYKLKDDGRFKGLCSGKSGAPRITQADIGTYECSVYFSRKANAFVGGTDPEGCKSNYRGSVKLLIDTSFYKDRYEIWERWYDAAGKQVAGSFEGPYIYRPIEREPAPAAEGPPQAR